jgi:ABC-2 type transport system ATP-binding protein
MPAANRTGQAVLTAVNAVNAVTFCRVTKTYGKTLALSNVDLSIAYGCITAILGQNGAGKTTAIGLMLGMLKCTDGTVKLLGQDPTRAVNRQRIGAMLQHIGAPATLRVCELIALWSSYYPTPLPLGRLIEMADLAGLERAYFGKLSGGQRRRVAFALAMCGNPDVLFLDEPSVGLDVEARRSFWQQVRAFAQSGRTVVLTTHHLEEADALADRIVVLGRGNIIAEGSAAEIKARAHTRVVRCQSRLTIDQVRALPGVFDVKQTGRRLEITSHQAESTVRELLRRDETLQDLEVTNRGLEAAFIALTHASTKGAT